MKLLSAGLVVALTASTLHADSKSWSAVKGMLPDSVNIVAGANLSVLRGTSIYRSIVLQLVNKEPDAKQVIELLKSTCSIDLHTAIIDVTLAMSDGGRGIVVAAIDRSVNQKRLLDCATKLVATNTALATGDQAAPPPPTATAGGGLQGGATKTTPAPPLATKINPVVRKLVTKSIGKITEYGVEGDPKRIYVAWLAPDVVAIATAADDKALLAKMLGGTGTAGALASYLAKSSSNAAIWLASTRARSIQQGVNMKGAFGTIDAAKGSVAVDLNLVLADAKTANGLVEQVKSLFPSLKSNIPPQLGKLVDALRLSATADRANLKLSASEQDLMGAVSIALMSL